MLLTFYQNALMEELLVNQAHVADILPECWRNCWLTRPMLLTFYQNVLMVELLVNQAHIADILPECSDGGTVS